MFQQALNVAGADPADISTISDSFLDWVDIDENPHLSGSESADYIAVPTRVCTVSGQERADR